MKDSKSATNQQPKDNYMALRLILSFLIILVVIATVLFVVYSSNSQSKESIVFLVGMAFVTSLFIFLTAILPRTAREESGDGLSLWGYAALSLIVEFAAALLAVFAERYFFPLN